MTDASNAIENVDYVVVNGVRMTPDNVRGRFQDYRKKNFDLPLVAAPIVRESERAINAGKLTETQRYQLDHSNYDLSRGAVGDSRFLTEFDYYAALIRAAEDNAFAVSRLKRNIHATYTVVHALYGKVYSFCLLDRGKEMGSNSESRRAWFQANYPALYAIDSLYSDFIDEIDIELDRWQEYARGASRMLSAAEMSYSATGRFYNHRRGSYITPED